MNKKEFLILGIVAALGLFVVGFDQGHIFSLIYGEQAFTDLYIHELTHDMRHAVGFDCHDKSHNETVWQEAYGQHVWDTGYGIGAWTGTPEGMEPTRVGAYIGGGSINLDPDLSPTYALDFAAGSYLTILSILGVFGIISSLFLVPYFILKRKNIPSRPYMSLILVGLLLHYGITNLISSLIHFPTVLLETSKSYMFEQLFIFFLIPVIVLTIPGILLYRSSLIRKWLKR